MFPKIDHYDTPFPCPSREPQLEPPASRQSTLPQWEAREATAVEGPLVAKALIPPSSTSAIAKPTVRSTAATAFSFGYELELHRYLLARVVPHGDHGMQMTLMDTAPLFEASSLTACTDAVLGTRAHRGLMDLRQAGVDWHVGASAGDTLMKVFHPMNVIELNTHAAIMPRDTQMVLQSERQIRAIDGHLTLYLQQPGPPLVRLDAWIGAFNAAHPADLRLMGAAGIDDVHILRGEHTRELLNGPGKSYYAQVNVSTTLEAWGDAQQSLDGYLADYGSKRDAGRVFRDVRLKVLEESRATATEAVTLLRGGSVKPQMQWRKLRGFFTLVGTVARTESAPSMLRSTAKNQYLFFIKNKINDVREMCLSERDKAQLRALTPQAREALTELLAQGDADRPMPTNVPDRAVTVRQFLTSALGWGARDVCDQLENPGLLKPQAEPEGGHRKAPIARVVVELRDVVSVDTSQEVFDIVAAATRDAPRLNSTAHLEKVPDGLGKLVKPSRNPR